MTTPSSQGIFLTVLQGGGVTLTAAFTTFAGSGVPLDVSGVTITITPAVGGTPTVGPTTVGVVGQGAAWRYAWLPDTTVAGGDYTVVWMPAVPSGTPPIVQTVTVVAPPPHSPSPGLYATVAQFRGRERDTLIPDDWVLYWLQQATEVIDVALVGAVYSTDADQMPTDPGLLSVLERACCAQAAFMAANNDPANVKSQFSSSNVGGVPLVRAPSAQGLALPPLAPRAAAILRVSGVLPSAPLINW